MLSLMGKVRNLFAIDVGHYTKKLQNEKLLLKGLVPFGVKQLNRFFAPKFFKYGQILTQGS